MKNKNVLQFKITLLDLMPAIWRRIHIVDSCTFWDLHVAIQDSMGWDDSHLHEFSIVNPSSLKKESIGMPDEDGFSDYAVRAGWECKVMDFVQLKKNKKFTYVYDFGDSWEHLIEFEGVYEKQLGKYPKCIDGARACPPEDIGGTSGYENFLSIITNPKHKERAELLEWVGGKFDPEKFDVKKIKFHNPKTRCEELLS